MASVDDIVRGLTKAQAEALLWLPDKVGAIIDSAGTGISGSVLAALVRNDLAYARWTPFPRIERPWSITTLGLEVRARLLSSSGEE